MCTQYCSLSLILCFEDCINGVIHVVVLYICISLKLEENGSLMCQLAPVGITIQVTMAVLSIMYETALQKSHLLG